MPTTQRGYLGALVDRFGHRQLRFPPEKCSYTITDVRIPVTDGDEKFELLADLYRPVLPQDGKPAGTLLVRCPYGRGPMLAFSCVRAYAACGYVVLYVSSRGTFGSGSTFDPFRNEEHDGHAVVEWMRQQDWYTGTFGTLGVSYLGFVQWALLKDPPPDMKQILGTGSLSLEIVEWGQNVARQEDGNLSHLITMLTMKKTMRPVFDRTPLADSVKAHFNGSAPWLDYVVDHLDMSDPRYDQMNMTEALERADIPILLISGLYDLCAVQTFEQYARLSERKTNVALTVGPWNHLQGGTSAKVCQQSFDWLDVHLSKRKSSWQEPPVQYFVTGAQEWRQGPVWPPPTKQQILHLLPDHKLASTEPGMDKESSSTFTFNPQDPTPSIGGNLLLGGGSANDTAFATRADVLTFTSEPLADDLEVRGKITVELSHASDTPNVDIFVRISEVNAKGTSQSVTDVYRRLATERDDVKLTFGLRDCAHRFAKGNCVRLVVAGASYPQYDNTRVKAVHTVHHGKSGVSRVVLPVTAR